MLIIYFIRVCNLLFAGKTSSFALQNQYQTSSFKTKVSELLILMCHLIFSIHPCFFACKVIDGSRSFFAFFKTKHNCHKEIFLSNFLHCLIKNGV